MKKNFKKVTSVCCALSVMGCSLAFSACDKYVENSSELLNEIADGFALALMGDDIFSWNAYSVSPSKSFGYTQYTADENLSWYSYSTLTASDAKATYNAFNEYKTMLKKVDAKSLSGVDVATYNSVSKAIDVYMEYYGSKYVTTFELIDCSYISSDGGYVASFASSFENFDFRDERDVANLLTVTISTERAFDTYIDYAFDRNQKGYPLYDYTVNGMCEYLDDVYDDGENYYLYDVIDAKLDNAEFLSDSVREDYRARYNAALTENFMTGVHKLSEDLSAYSGQEMVTQRSYLASAGSAGRAYYEWLFYKYTGEKKSNNDMLSLYNTLYDEYAAAYNNALVIAQSVEAMEQTNPDVYNEFNALLSGESSLLGLETPQEILEYLKEAAKSIVYDLQTEPTIGFKYMDDTVATRSNTTAYYSLTPLDDLDSAENITINGYSLENSSMDLLPLLAHEGYPGHLYAYVNAKENGTKLISVIMNSLAFAEGWAQYAELATLEYIADTESGASALYADYTANMTYANYLGTLMSEMQVNYFGYTVSTYVGMGIPMEEAKYYVETFMEIPAVYVPYGYGMYVMCDIHKDAKDTLGDKYDAKEFNKQLLADGFAPTLTRAREIQKSYVKNNK